MTLLQGFFTALSAVILFIFSLQGFSRELQRLGGKTLQTWLPRVTAGRWKGFIIGMLATAVVQSSSAVTALAVTLVDASVMTFRGSLGILLGANVGTTTTAWLVSFKLTGIGPFFIVIGALLAALPTRLSFLGKAIFYFGFIFFALNLISTELKPLQSETWFQAAMAEAQIPWLGILIGLGFTALIQSSSVTTGLAILLVQQGILPPDAAISIVLGSNVGSTSTALIASLAMNSVARATAISNFLFNLTGVLLFFPFLTSFSQAMLTWWEPSMVVAGAHLVFNISIAFLFLVTLGWIEPLLRKWILVVPHSN